MQLTSARILDRHYFQSISSTMNLDSRCLLLVAMDDLYYYATGTYDYSNRNSPVEVRRYVESYLDISTDQLFYVINRNGGELYLVDKERALQALANSLHSNKHRAFCREVFEFFLAEIQATIGDNIHNDAIISDLLNNYVNRILKNKLFG